MIASSLPLILGCIFGAIALGIFISCALIYLILKDAPEIHDHEL